MKSIEIFCGVDAVDRSLDALSEKIECDHDKGSLAWAVHQLSMLNDGLLRLKTERSIVDDVDVDRFIDLLMHGCAK